MDSQLLVNLLNEFDELRMSRMHLAQKFLAEYSSEEELLADVANILALLYAGNKIARMPKGFKSDSGS